MRILEFRRHDITKLGGVILTTSVCIQLLSLGCDSDTNIQKKSVAARDTNVYLRADSVCLSEGVLYLSFDGAVCRAALNDDSFLLDPGPPCAFYRSKYTVHPSGNIEGHESAEIQIRRYKEYGDSAFLFVFGSKQKLDGGDAGKSCYRECQVLIAKPDSTLAAGKAYDSKWCDNMPLDEKELWFMSHSR